MIRSMYKWINLATKMKREQKEELEALDETMIEDNNEDNSIEDVLGFIPNPIILKLLAIRGITKKEDIIKFFNGNINDMYDPFLIKDMDCAAKRIIKALKNNEKITVYGDYDVDGITSTTVLYSFLKKVGADVNYYIPNRIKEGYGMNKTALKKIAQDETDLIITVDTGITAVEEAKIVKDLGMELVITDHHEVAGDIPDAVAVVDSKRSDDTYPFKELAGVGVAYKTIKALDMMLKEDKDLALSYLDKGIDVTSYLEYVVLGTISDVVPLVDENRIIVKEGMKLLKNTKNVGIKALLSATLQDIKNMTARDIAFMVVPKLNAAGRIADASIGVELLTEEDEEEAKNKVKDLIKKNDERKKSENKILEEAIDIIDKDEHYKNERVIVVKNELWHNGVIGIVASRLAEKYFKPVIIMNEENGMLSGSARTMGGVNIFKVIDNAKDLLSRYGGHEGAAGLSLKAENFSAFRDKVVSFAEGYITDDLLMPYLNVDMELNIDDITIDLVESLKDLEPFGEANEEPLFKIIAKVAHASLMGKANNHLRLKVKGDSNSFDCVAFNKGELYENIVIDKEFMFLGNLNINEFNGQRKVQMMLSDIKTNMSEQIENDYNISLFNKMRNEKAKNVLDDDKTILMEEKDVKVYKSLDEVYKAIDEMSKEEKEETILVVNNQKDLEMLANKYDSRIAIFYETVDDTDIKNAFENEGKELIVLSNNLVKIIDLRKKYTIMYIDSLEEYKLSDNETILLTKKDVADVYKRMNYLVKIQKDKIYIDELLYNLRELSIYKTLMSLEILKELGIMNYTLDNDDQIIFGINKDVKNAIDNSKLYNVVKRTNDIK